VPELPPQSEPLPEEKKSDAKGDLEESAALELRELHPLIARAATEGWSREDYPSAVRNAWFALRDLLRARLNRGTLDGVGLVNAIGEDKPPIALPLTKYETETEKNQHRGVVSFLRGCVFTSGTPTLTTGQASMRMIA
jgi:hypothetical protein